MPGRPTLIRILKSDERSHANQSWLDTHFSFSFADYYDPKHVHFPDGRDGSVKIRQDNDSYATVLGAGETLKHDPNLGEPSQGRD